VTLLSTTALAGLLPRNGLVDWRVPSALTGGYYGGISYNPFVGIRQQLLSPTNAPIFYAFVEGTSPTTASTSVCSLWSPSTALSGTPTGRTWPARRR